MSEIVRALEPYGGQEQQRQEQRPAAVRVLVVPPAVVGRQIRRQCSFQRPDQAGLVGDRKEQQRARTLPPLGLTRRRCLIFPPRIGSDCSPLEPPVPC